MASSLVLVIFKSFFFISLLLPRRFTTQKKKKKNGGKKKDPLKRSGSGSSSVAAPAPSEIKPGGKDGSPETAMAGCNYPHAAGLAPWARRRRRDHHWLRRLPQCPHRRVLQHPTHLLRSKVAEPLLGYHNLKKEKTRKKENVTTLNP